MRTSIVEALDKWLVHPWLPIHLAGLALVLTLPALWIGWQFDDHFHRLTMVGHKAVDVRPLEVFSTIRGEAGVLDEYVDIGLCPWWTAAGFRLAFFRYLSALSMWLDYRWWPDSPALMHLHSLAWCAALIAVVTLLYRRVLGATWWAGLAALLYAVDDAHVGPASWLANRNALLAAVFGVLTVWSFDRFRRGGSRRWAALSPIFLALALSSGEMAIATGGYLLAYALFLDVAPWPQRSAALLPHAAVVIGWATVYRVFDFGARGSGLYLDPLGQPVAFAGALLAHAPVLLLGQWSPVPADWALLFPPGLFWRFWTAGLVVAGLLGVFAAPLLRASATARFWALGMVLSLVPIAAVAPANRLLLFVSLGAMGLLAELMLGLRERSGWVPEARWWRVPAAGLAVALAITHLGLSPLVRPVATYALKLLGDPMIEAIASVPDDPAIADQDLVLVNPPDYLFLVSPIGALKMLEGRPYPKRLRGLVTGTSPVQVTRVDDFSLRVRTAEGIYGGVLGRLFRSSDDPMHAGQRFEIPGMSVEIARTNAAGEPLEFVHTFAVPLEDPALRWLQWRGDRYVPFVPPTVGDSVLLPPAYGPMDVMR